MSGRRTGLPVRVVAADAGPLISLAACDRLALLELFQTPVRVPDVVKAECVRDANKIGAAVLAEWFGRAAAPVEILDTPLIGAWREAAVSGDPRSTDGLGDAAIAWLLARLRVSAEGPTLVLTEDGPFGDGALRDRFPEVHALSTRAFLRTLENFGRIPSAERVVEEILASGRRLARYLADRPGRPAPALRTSWAERLVEDGGESAAGPGPGAGAKTP